MAEDKTMNQTQEIKTIESKYEIEESRYEIKTTSRMRDVLKVLLGNERAILEFLIENGGTTTQAKVHRSLHMPRSSLSRRMHSLQRRGLVDIKENGKLNRITLATWLTQEDADDSISAKAASVQAL